MQPPQLCGANAGGRYGARATFIGTHLDAQAVHELLPQLLSYLFWDGEEKRLLPASSPSAHVWQAEHFQREDLTGR